MSNVIRCPEGRTGTYAIPSGVGEISAFAFANCSRLIDIAIPDGVTSIGSSAFSGCSALASISLPPSITVVPSDAFSDCVGLEIVAIPLSVSEIYPGAFSNCRSLTSITIPTSVEFIGDGAFLNCSSLTSISIPTSTSTISLFSFAGCSSLKSIQVEPGNPTYSSLDGILFNAAKTVLIRCPEGKSGKVPVQEGVTYIAGVYAWGDGHGGGIEGEGAFAGCSQLTSILIPESVTGIGGYVFDGCSQLQSITVVPGNSSYASVNGVLYDASLTQLLRCPEGMTGAYSIPSGVTRIGDTQFSFWHPFVSPRGFANCTQLTQVTIPRSVTEIGRFVFSGCPATRTYEGYPDAPWLVSHGLPYNTGLNQDLNHDGVSLLMAYALDLDPNANLSQQMPTPVLTADSLTITFHAAAPGITYIVQTSTDLQTWTTTGVTLSEPDLNGMVTGSVDRDGARHFLQLVVIRQ